ncbi:non-hydrolyzing UDP-N-acetylglucosamine 2-epimerase [Pontibacter sp. G13]|uniref:non-hydrolyzing UDP-N-acetylglucosamine 2-epimerase n=1 Tax=Pontibacter sp. G13 TaxID=3074898 RepID=UPI00288B2FF4|nr:UDP-N-acetylglucosamine 2-epimerase (non-hydrolyzing) [Pontibacter sp. G13]WNJ19777.1 UDP-N-acetylglucosamine 2-epimerase (non-hydrolyzing) [Pontibacter sp. G13]
MKDRFKVMSLVGARPQFIKLAPLCRAIEQFNARGGVQIDHFIVHTGQHYDHGMSDIFFEELEIPRPDLNLGVGSGKHGAQTAEMLKGTEDILLQEKPDILVIFGDTNSTAAGALAAAKLHIPIAHIEAGLRSFNRDMPEEINRVMSDHLSDILLAPTPTAIENLKREGLADRTESSGDIMYDTVMFNTKLARQKSTLIQDLQLEGQSIALATIHRAENTNDTQRLETLLNKLNEFADHHLPVVFPMHPRTKNMLPNVLPDWKPSPNLRVIEPVGYLDMLALIDHARLALTDSGGLQKEAFFLNTPCITLRDETEWVETIQAGGNRLAGADPELIDAAIADWAQRWADQTPDFTEAIHEAFGRADSAEKTIDAIVRFLEKSLPETEKVA